MEEAKFYFRVSEMRPLPLVEEHPDMFPDTLDDIDGAARVLDPVFSGINKKEIYCGQFLKDYKPTEW